MSDAKKTRGSLLQTVAQLRRRVVELAAGASRHKQVGGRVPVALLDYVEVFEEIPLPATLIDPQGIIVDINRAFLDYAQSVGRNIRKEDRIGRSIYDFADTEETRAHLASLLDPLMRGERQHLSKVDVYVGRRRHCEDVHASAIRDPAGRVAGILLLREDVTEKMRQEEQRQALLRVREEIWRMAGSEGMERLLVAVRDGLERLGVPFRHCGVNLVDARTDPPSVQFHNMKKTGYWVYANPEDTATKVILRFWRDQQVVYRKDLRQEDRYGESANIRKDHGAATRSVVDVPFSHGTLAVNSTEPEAFSGEDLEILQEMAQVLSEGFRRRDDLQRLEQRNQELQREIAGRIQTNERLNLILDNLPLVVFELDAAGRWVLSRGRELEKLGRLPDEVAGKSIFEIYQDRPAILEAVRKAFAGQPQQIEVEVSGYLWLANYLPMAGASGKVERVFGTALDITERKQAEEVLKESEERFRQLVENIDSVFWIINDERTQSLYVSPAHEKIWGSPRQGMDEDPTRWRESIHPEDRDRVVAGLERMAAGGYDESYRIVRPDNGSMRWVRTRAFPIRDESGKVYRIAGITTDITEARLQEEQREVTLALQRVRNEILLMERQEDWEKVALACRRELDALVRFAQCSIVLVDLQQGSGRAYYCPVSGEVRVSSYAQIHPLLVRTVASGVPAYRRTRAEIERGEERIPRGIGSVIDLPFASGTLAVNSPEENAFGKREIRILEQFAQVMSEAHRRLEDLQALEKKEAQLRQSQKLEAIGQLAGGMAHDFNNLLTIINGYSEVLQRRFAAQDPGSEYLQEIQKAADRGAGLVRQLLAFSRRQMLQPEVLNLNTVIADLSKMLQRLIGEHIELHLGLGPGLEKVKADRGQLEQVLLNLVVNARDAMPQGGRLSIETGNAELEPGYARQQVVVQPGAYALLRVSDTGVGMAEEVQARIFEPFFTTKEPGKGTGLGLATVYGIVKQSGGYIWVHSAPGQGAAFEIYLPCVAEEVRQAAGREEVDRASLQGGETLLLVEDEEPVRRLMAVALRERGYTVLEAGNGDEALQVGSRDASPIHLLVTDVVMPGMNGRQLAERLGARHPEMKVLYVSGYTEGIIEEQGILAPQVAVLRKPFTLDSLALKIREVLGSAR